MSYWQRQAKSPERIHARALPDLAQQRVQGGGPKLFKRMRQQLWRRRVLRPLALGLAILAGVIALFGFLLTRRLVCRCKMMIVITLSTIV